MLKLHSRSMKTRCKLEYCLKYQLIFAFAKAITEGLSYVDSETDSIMRSSIVAHWVLVKTMSHSRLSCWYFLQHPHPANSLRSFHSLLTLYPGCFPLKAYLWSILCSTSVFLDTSSLLRPLLKWRYYRSFWLRNTTAFSQLIVLIRIYRCSNFWFKAFRQRLRIDLSRLFHELMLFAVQLDPH